MLTYDIMVKQMCVGVWVGGWVRLWLGHRVVGVPQICRRVGGPLVLQDFPCGRGRGKERRNCRQDSVDDWNAVRCT